jgi:hypothetical protein
MHLFSSAMFHFDLSRRDHIDDEPDILLFTLFESIAWLVIDTANTVTRCSHLTSWSATTSKVAWTVVGFQLGRHVEDVEGLSHRGGLAKAARESFGCPMEKLIRNQQGSCQTSRQLRLTIQFIIST